jgi:endo-1,4-beta-xylanase
MHIASSLLFLAALPFGMAGKDNGKGKGNGPKRGLDTLARKAGLKYFGAATDTPGQREREPYPQSYEQYDQIMWDSDEFGSTTPTNGHKVGPPSGFRRLPRADLCSGCLPSPPRASSTSPRATS